MAMIEEECRRYRPTKNYLAHLPTPNYDIYMTDVMKAEYERIQTMQPMELLSMKRYELPGPAPGKLNDIQDWQEAVDNSKAQLEHLIIRRSNLQLLQEYGAEQYRMYNDALQTTLNLGEKQLMLNKSAIVEINANRKRTQSEAGEKLKALERSWVQLVGKNYQIEKSCYELEAEMLPLRKKYKV